MGWGALPNVFADVPDREWGPVAARVRAVLSDVEWRRARASTLNAHYTDPGYAAEIWRLVNGLGIETGRVLEPGCGTGVFFGTCPNPPRFALTGVEIDPTTATIAQLLYPGVLVRREALEAARFPDGWFDATVGNVPFSSHAPFDPIDNRAGFALHNYAIAKAARVTRAGGIVVVITSLYSLDATGRAWRDAMAESCDFVGAVRLPSGAHHTTAGTAVVTDLVVFRRRPPGQAARHAGDWAEVVDVAVDGGVVAMNEWFANHPDRIIGEARVGRGMYRDGQLVIDPPTDATILDALRVAVDDTISDADQLGLTATPPPATVPAGMSAAGGELVVPVGVKDGSFQLVDGTIMRAVDGRFVPLVLRFKTETVEVRALIAVRDAVVAVLGLESASPTDSSELAAARGLLNRRYDAYVRVHGPISRSTLSSVIDDETGQVRWRRRTPAMGGFRRDPDFAFCLALEHYDDETAIATKAAIFTRRVIAPTRPIVTVDDPVDALAVVLNERGRVDIDRIAELLTIRPADAVNRLGGRVFENPATGGWETAETYLSGDVRTKHAAAATAAATDDGARFARNVAALAAVIPTDLTAGEIDVNLGAPWVPTAVVTAFITDVLGIDDAIVDHIAVTAQWTVTVPSWRRSGVRLTAEWGTSRRDGIALLEACLNQETVTVYDTLDDGRRVKNASETLLALEKQDKLRDHYRQWVWTDPTRADILARIYNDRFNSTVPTTWSGTHLALPGLTVGFAPHAHQRDAVWRIVAGGNTLLAHEVGAGKTATMCIAAMELRRLGLARKPALIVPNHMLEQFTREFLQLYPAANVLIATKDDTSRDERARFVARVATGDWDAVIMTQQSFARLPVHPDIAAGFLRERLDELHTLLASPNERGQTRTVKKIEKRVAAMEASLARLIDETGHDTSATFEQTGIDHLFVDEAHYFKNRRIITNIDAVGTTASKRAEDLAVKIGWLAARYPDRKSVV